MMKISRRKLLSVLPTIGVFQENAFSKNNGRRGGPVKVAFVYVGPVGDQGWTHSHEQGRKFAASVFKGSVAFTMVENVPEGDGSIPVFRRLIAQGNDLIFGTAFGYMEPMVRLADEFPHMRFESATGNKIRKNLRVYDIKTYEAAYLAGIVAGFKTEAKSLGVVASIPIPDVLRNINAFTLGAQSMASDVAVTVRWADSWFDPRREYELANALIDAGSDVLFQTTDSTSIMVAAEKRGKFGIGIDSDLSSYGPNAHLASVVPLWGNYYVHAINQHINRTWSSTSTWWGLAEGSTDLVGLHASLPADLVKIVNETRSKIADRSFDIWRGPLHDEAGRLVLPMPKALSELQVKNMDFFVKGVNSNLAKV